MDRRVVALFTLKDGFSVLDYAQWSRDRVRPVMRSMPSVLEFDDFRVTGYMDGERLTSQLCELITVTDFDAFERDNATGDGDTLAKEWRARMESWSVLYLEDLLPV